MCKSFDEFGEKLNKTNELSDISIVLYKNI